ncbi:MAG: type II secretion system protein [Candidatus Omnitrophota bacterium]|nr:type II secretion system protein [Candidatus Omnitrophota bacterium]
MRRNRTASGATLLEILVAMLIIGLVSTGLITAFIFGRRMTLRSGTELSGANLVQETTEILRTAGQAALPPAGELTLAPGVYVDENMDDDGSNIPAGAVLLSGLNLPADFQRFLTDPGTGTSVAAANHGDGRLVIVEDAGDDFDGDGQGGISFDGGATTALRRVRVRVKWTSPTT